MRHALLSPAILRDTASKVTALIRRCIDGCFTREAGPQAALIYSDLHPFPLILTLSTGQRRQFRLSVDRSINHWQKLLVAVLSLFCLYLATFPANRDALLSWEGGEVKAEEGQG